MEQTEQDLIQDSNIDMSSQETVDDSNQFYSGFPEMDLGVDEVNTELDMGLDF